MRGERAATIVEEIVSSPHAHRATKLHAWLRLGRRRAVVGMPSALALAVVSGMAYATAFPPLSWPLAAWVSLVPLLVACAALSPRRAAVAGVCWTATAGVGVAWFLPAMLSRYFGLAAVPSVLASVTILAWHASWVSAYAAWVAWTARRRRANPVLLAGGWLLCELARAHGPLGSPWALLAYSQLGSASLVQLADLAGPYGIGLVVAVVNAGAAAMLVPALRGRRPVRTATAIVAALAGVLVYGQWRLHQTFDDGPAVPVVVVQGGAAPATPTGRAERLARYVSLTAGGVDAHTRLIVWPEYAIDAYLEEATTTRDAVLGTARDARADLVLGGPHFETAPSGTRYHNSAYLVRDGRLAARYDKHRLVPFAEDDQLAWLLGDKAVSYAPGQGTFVLPATDVRAGTLLCLEAMFPELARRAVGQGAEILVNLSNDAWFASAAAARHQLAIATLRAVETRRHLVRAAATGVSAVIDPHGRTLGETEFDANQVLHATVRASRVRSPYQRWGDALAYLVIAGVVAATLRPLRDHPADQL